ncbi:MAG: ABC transporter ATP-binding protein, partial [Lachnospiraceae bacterium]|nr:ABC transporter ATP-binding protein [Lachnospiraceae bacterium]
MTKALACADRVASVLEIGTDVGENGNDAANGKDQAENGTAAGKSGAQGAASSDDAQPVETFVGASVAQREDANYLVFDHVAMKYRGAGEETLEDVSFAVRKGDTVGVIGGTGSGKSSLVNLIPGFYPATQGRILLEGKELSSFDEAELRNRMGVVPQKAVLFQGTIRSNLLWGKPDATEEEMWNALELAQAKEIVEGKDGKLDAEVAQNGRNFSGGQRQRLTIARALVRKPEILILDDSASALDYATDAKLRASVRSIKDQTTTFIVSQRASSIRHADLIIVLDDGRVAGLGTHDELLASCEVYQEIYYSQYPEERKGAVTNG